MTDNRIINVYTDDMFNVNAIYPVEPDLFDFNKEERIDVYTPDLYDYDEFFDDTFDRFSNMLENDSVANFSINFNDNTFSCNDDIDSKNFITATIKDTDCDIVKKIKTIINESYITKSYIERKGFKPSIIKSLSNKDMKTSVLEEWLRLIGGSIDINLKKSTT